MILSISEIGLGSKGAVHKKKKIKLLKECKREKTKNNCEQKEKKNRIHVIPLNQCSASKLWYSGKAMEW